LFLSESTFVYHYIPALLSKETALTVVTYQSDDSVVAESVFVQSRENLSEIEIHIGCGSIIVLPDLELKILNTVHYVFDPILNRMLNVNYRTLVSLDRLGSRNTIVLSNQVLFFADTTLACSVLPFRVLPRFF
jgi:hypothetical protein